MTRPGTHAPDVAQVNTARPGQVDRLLDRDAGTAALQAELEPLERRGDHAAVVAVLERAAGATADAADAARLYLRAGMVLEDRLLRRDAAVLLYARALRLDPGLRPARQAALRCQLALRRFAGAYETLGEMRRAGTEPAALSAEYARLGQLLVEEPLEHDLARRALEDALTLDPAATGPRAALARVREAAGTWRDDATALQALGAEAKERRTAAQLVLRAAALHAAHDPEPADRVVALVERALLLAPGLVQGVDLVERCLSARGDWRGLADALARLGASVRERKTGAELQIRLARVELERFGDGALALAALERALALDPSRADAAQQAFELHSEAGRAAEALSALERHLAAVPEAPDHEPWRVAAAELALGLGDALRARGHLEAARRIAPGSVRVATLLAPLLEAAGEWRDAAEAHAAVAAAAPDAPARVDALERLAGLELARLGSPREALRHLGEALCADPGRPSLRRALDAAAAGADLFPELAAAYEAAARAPAADAATAKLLWRRAAEVWDRDLGRPDDAAAAWREVLRLDGADPGARAALEACLVRAGRVAEVERDLRAAMPGADAQAQGAALARLARYHQEAGDPQGAARCWRDAVAAGDDGPATLRTLADALGALGREARAERLEVLGRLASRLDGPERAAVELERAGLVEAGDAAVDDVTGALAAALRDGVTSGGDPAREVAALEHLAEQLGDGREEERATLLLRAARLREDATGDAGGAFAAAAAALRAAPWLGDAQEACVRLGRRTGAALAVHDALAEAADRCAGRPADERALREWAAEVAEQDLGDPAAAAVQLRRVVALAPADPVAAAALTRALLGAERWDEACEVLRSRAAAAGGAERGAMLSQLAELLHDRLGRPGDAARAWREALAAASDDARPRLLRRLAAALAETGDAEAQAEALVEAAEEGGDARALLAELERLAARTEDPSARAAVERRAARLWGERLGQWSLTLAALERAARARPDDAALRAELRDAAVRAGAPADAARAYRAFLPGLPAAAAAEAWGELAGFAEEQLADGDGATAAWSEVLRLRPADPVALGALARLHGAAGRHRERVDACLALAERTESDRERLQCWRDAAALLERELGDPAGAVEVWERLAVLDPDDGEAQAALERLLATLDRPAELAAALERRRAHGGAADRELASRLADLYRARLDAPERAVALLREVLAARPEDAAARAGLAELSGAPGEAGRAALDAVDEALRASGEHAARVAARERRLAVAQEPPERTALHAEVLRILEDDLRRPDLAFAAAARAFAEGGPVADAVEPDLARLAGLAGAEGRLADAYDAAAVTAAPALVLELRRRAARLRDGRASAEDAIAAWQRVLEAAAADAEALASLARLHASAGDTAAVAGVLRAQADLARDDAPRRLALLLERARLLEPAGDGTAALEAYLEVLAEARQDPAALEGLERLLSRPGARDRAGRVLEESHRARGDARRLLPLLRARLERAGRGERGALLAEVATLHERLGEYREALEARVSAVEETVPPGEDAPGARADLERLAALAGAHRELAGAYERLLARGLPAAAALEVARRLAGLYADRLGRPDLAVRTLEAAAAGTGDAEVLATLARLHRASGAWRELVGVLRRQAEHADPQARKDLLLEVAAVAEQQLSDREGAMEAYRQILSVDPEDPNALRLLGQLLGAAERWDELVDVLGREAELAERRPNLVAEAAELRFRVGRIRERQLSDVAGALQCYRGVLDRVPRHPAALSALEELARAGGSGAAEAATVLEPIYEQEGEHGKLIETLEARAAAAADAGARSALLRRVAQVQAGALRNPEMGFLSAARALRDAPEEPEALALAARLADQAGLHEELGTLLGEVADRPRAPAARLELRRFMAQLASRGPDPLRAADAWARVLDLAPDDRPALDGLAAAHRATGDAAALASVLRRTAALEEGPTARAAFLAELAELQRDRLGDAAGAMATLRQLLELEPSRREALAALDALCVQAERWVELADVLAREAAAADAAGDADASRAFRLRLAELKETRLLDREGALALYEAVLASRPDDPQALARVEAALQRDPGQLRAAAALERAYAATGAWARYAAVLEVRAGERPDPVERKALFLDLAEVHERRLGSPELAFVALCRAFRDDPVDPSLRRELERLATAAGHAEELAGLYEDEFERLPPAAAGEVALSLGDLYQTALGDAGTATAWLERARRLDPAAAPRALSALERLYRARGAHAELADVLDEQARLAAPEDRAALLFRLGQHCEEQLQDAGRAARAYQALVSEQPRHGAALRALERIHDAAGQLDALASNLETQRALATDAPARLRLTARLAATRQALGDDGAAVTLWREVLELDPRHEPALGALELLLERLERWPELVALVRERIAVTADRRETARLQEKLGDVLGRRLGDPGQAVRAYQAVLEADPRHRGALEALRALQAGQGDLEGLASTLRRLVPLQEDAAGVKSVRLELAGVLLRAGKGAEAAEQGRRAMELEPHDEAELTRLVELFQGAGAAQDAVKAEEARAALLSAAGQADAAIAAWLRAADGWERLAGGAEGAAVALGRVLELAPGHREAWTRLKSLHARSGDWRAYVAVCDLFTGHLPDAAERLELMKELAAIHEERLGQKEMAFVSLCRAFGDAPGDAAVVSAMQRLAGETGGWEELAGVYEQVADAAHGRERAALLLELGRVRDARLDDADGAEAAFRAALEADPASPAGLDALADLFTRRGRVRDLVIALEQKLEAAAGLDEKKATLLELARIYDGPLRDPAEAIDALRRVLELDGGDAEAIAALAGAYQRQARWGDLAGILARARDLAPDPAARIGYQLRLAGLHENELADAEAAVEAYRAALALDDRNAEALAGLERVYTRLDRLAELNQVYERQAELAADPRERVRILGKSAAIWEEKLANPRRAIEQNEAILALDGEDVGAVKRLEALYRRERMHDRLIAVLQHHAALTRDRTERAALQAQIGDVWWNDLGRPDRAEGVLAEAIETDPSSREAVAALARLHEQQGSWTLALERLQRQAELAGPGPELVSVQWRIGRIHDERLQDRAAARLAYGRALDADPGHLPSIRALRAIAEAEGDRDGYLRLLRTEARYADGDAEKATLLHEAARILQEERDDAGGAVTLYQEALAKVPDFVPAARPLADLLVARQDWAGAEAVLDAIVAALSRDGEPQDLCRQCYRLGHVAERLGNRGKALESYRRAYEIDPTYLPALEGLAALLVQAEAWEEALRIHQAMLIHHRDGLTDAEVVGIHAQIGELHERLGQPDRAARSYEKALELDPAHLAARGNLVRVLEGLGEWAAAVESRHRLAAQLQGDARRDMLVAIGTACRDRLHDPHQAVDAFSAAARLDPGDPRITEALLGLYRETRQGQKAADVLHQLVDAAEARQDAAAAARLHHALAVTLRDELKDEAGAIRELDRALDADPRDVRAFADLEALLTRGQRWRELEQAYLRMIQRLPKTADVAPARVALWKTLGELYRRVLHDDDNARMAYQVVVRATPDDAAALAHHAELSARVPGHAEEAIGSYRRLVAVGDAPAQAVSALIRLHADARQFDAAYLAAQAQAYLLGAATPDEAQVVSRLRRFSRETATGALDDAGWEALLHDRVRGPLPAILALLAREATDLFVQDPKALGLNPRKDELEVAGSRLFFASMYRYVAKALGLPLPQLFRATGEGPRLQVLPLARPALAAREELFQEQPKKELWFTIGKAMAFLRPELMLARFMPHDQLEALFQAAVSLGTSRFTPGADPHLVAKLRRRLENTLPVETRTQRLKLLARAYCDVQRPGDVRAYMDGAELTSNRVGALLAGDAEVARRMVVAEKAAVSKLREETRVRDLVAFFTSEGCAALRDRLGLSVVVPASG